MGFRGLSLRVLGLVGEVYYGVLDKVFRFISDGFGGRGIRSFLDFLSGNYFSFFCYCK